MSDAGLEFVEAEGEVHLANLPNLPEFTLCGDAYDLGSMVDDYEWFPTKSRTVTCPKCAAIILACRGVRVSKGSTHD